MANNNSGVLNSWSFVEFSHKFTKLKYAKNLVNKAGERFTSLVAIDDAGNYTFINFSKKLGVLTPAELKERKQDLQVVLNTGADSQEVYTLCNKGANTWEDIDI